MKKYIYFPLCFLLISLPAFAQQDPQYNLYQFNQLIINPAYAGARDGLAVVAARRQQWVGFEGAPQTTCLSIHGSVLKKNLGLGLTIVNDEMGPRNVIGAYGNIAYMLKLSPRMRLSFGVNAGYNRYQFNFTKIKFQSGETPGELYQNQNQGALDINSGLYLKANSFFVGFSATHLNDASVYTYAREGSDSGRVRYRLKTHVFLTAGKSFLIGKNLVFAPTILVKQVNTVVSADLNLNFFLYQRLWLGAFYRNQYGPGALLQFYVNNRFRVGYSYDTGLQDARRLGGSHEVMIGIDLGGQKQALINPRFL